MHFQICSRMKILISVFLFVLVLAHCLNQNGKIEHINSPSQLHLNEDTTQTISAKGAKELIIQKITNQIQSLAQTALKNTKSLEEKQNVIQTIKLKLIESAKKKQKKLGMNDNTLQCYVDTILGQIDSAMLNSTNNRRSGSYVDDEFGPSSNKKEVQENKIKGMNKSNIHLNMDILKDKLIKDIAAKVDKISRIAMEQINNTEDIYYVMGKLKDKLLFIAKNRQKALNLNEDNLNSYVNVIMKSVEHNLKSNANLANRRIFDLKPEDEPINYTLNNINDYLSHHRIPKENVIFCENIEKQICEDIKFVLKATCPYDDTELHLNKICNGFVDCPDASDETNCSQQILPYIHKTNKILKLLVSHISHQCLEGKEGTEMKSQSKVLNDVLKTQVAIIKSHALLGNSALRYDKDFNNVQHTALNNDVASVIVMTSNAIYSVLCKEKYDEKNFVVLTRKMSEALDENLERTLEKIVQNKSKNCACLKQHCEKDSCPERCKTVCKNKYFLGRWSCSDEVSSVPLDLICDGKTDCFDESDEYGCDSRNHKTRIENGRTYDDVLSLIGLMTNSYEFSHVNNRMNVLAELVKKLREATMRPTLTLHPSNVKAIRNEVFDIIKSIYDESLKELASDDRISRIHDFLRNISSKLLLVLKHSHTGNTKVVSNEICWCQESRCIMPNCVKPCQRACAMEQRIVNHTCSHNKNITIPLQKLCDGRSDCPLGEDEDDCMKDICQRHHLLTLANILKTLGKDIKSPSLLATIQNWRQEAIEKTKKVHKNLKGRPTRPIIRRLLTLILKDLVMSYAAVAVTRRNNFEIVKKEYDKVSYKVRNFYKSCEH